MFQHNIADEQKRERFSKVLKHQVNRFRTICTVWGFVALSWFLLIHYKDRRASAAVIPAQAGIWNFNASRIYRKKPKPFRRHSHESGNLEMKSNRNLSEMTETERTGFPLLREWRFSCYGYCQVSVMLEFRDTYESSFPRRRESSPFGTETYRIKRFLQILRSRFPLSWEWRDFRFLFLVFCFRGNDEILSFRNLPEKTETALPSFPRRRESRP